MTRLDTPFQRSFLILLLRNTTSHPRDEFFVTFSTYLYFYETSLMDVFVMFVMMIIMIALIPFFLSSGEFLFVLRRVYMLALGVALALFC
ncbi:hypothetical protein M405DRAFT_557189 [Rhizopogon salebrosus TDB-379]|nr:hypothetical protein M405DRAFT_557189 [Rhizopogon salebrosus TDB-379]